MATHDEIRSVAQEPLPSPAGGETLATRLAQRAQEGPGRIAIFDDVRRLTWDELDQHVTGIASQILGALQGVRAPQRVLLLFRDRIAAIEALLGTVRSGNTLVMLESGDPEERVRFIAADAEPALIVTEASLRERVNAIAPPHCAVVEVAAAGAQSGAALPMPQVDPRSIAYMGYTSGSTGQPKGVRQTHAAQLFFADTYMTNVGLTQSDRVSLLHSVAFGSGLSVVARCVAYGITLGLYDLKQQGLAGLADWLDRERITVLQMIPTIFREFAAQLGRDRRLSHLRLLHLGAEGMFAEDYERGRELTGRECRFLHQLATTELSLIAQYLPARDVVLAPGSGVPAGTPIEGVRIEIRRDDGALATQGETGAIVAFSRYVSPGYWKRPDLDAETFIPDPLDPEGRGYRMSDLGYLDEQGVLHVIGRTGTRVKVRGHTVDLAEIDAALLAWPDTMVAAAAAEPDPDDALQMQLVAYVEARKGARRDARALLRFIAERLPRHMLPATVRFLAEFPRTANGKVDRKHLAAAPVLPHEAAPYAAPRDATEAAIAHVFGELLKLERAGRDDDFFLVGGDSMMAGELQSRIQDAFGVRVTTLHEDATVAGIAAAVRTLLAGAAPRVGEMPMLVPLREEGSEIPLFVVHGRHGQALMSPHFLKLLGNDQPVWGFQVRGLDGRTPPHPTIEAMIDDYAAEMRKVRPHGPYFLGGLCVGGYIAAALARKLRAEGEPVLPLLLLDPPNRTATGGYVHPDRIREKIHERLVRVDRRAEIEDPAYLDRSVQVALAFNEVIVRYVPVAYDGPAYVLSSHLRMQRDDPLELRKYFTGRVKRYQVGERHHDVLDPRNAVFESTLKRCLELIRATVPVNA